MLTDTAITASIKTDLLKDPDLSVLKIDVDTSGGVVTLNGLAGDEAMRTSRREDGERDQGRRRKCATSSASTHHAHALRLG